MQAASTGTPWCTKREQYIHNINAAYDRYLGKNDVTVLRGEARLTGPNEVEVDGTRYTAGRIVLAPGGEAVVPDIPGAELGVTSDGFFEFEYQPRGCA